MESPRIVVSTGRGRSHLYNAAYAAQQAGYLQLMITSFYLKDGWVQKVHKLEQLGCEGIGKFRLRHDARLDSDRIVGLWIPELLNKISVRVGERCPNFKIRMDSLLSHLYSWQAARYVEPPCNLVHARSGFSHAVILKARNTGVKVVLEQSTAHPLFVREILSAEYDHCGVPPDRRRYLRFEDEQMWDMNHADLLLTNSDFAAQTMVKNGVDPDSVEVVYTGVDPDLFKPYPEYRAPRFRVLCVATMSILKGIHYLLRAWQLLDLPDAELVLVGGKAADVPNEILARQDQFKQLGILPQYELPKVYSSASVFVLPSLCEGSSLAVAEAMACGLPVIVTHNSGSFARDGVDGYVIPAQDVDSLADRLLRLYRDPGLRIEMGRSARIRAEGEFTWEHYAQRVIKFYEDVVNE